MLQKAPLVLSRQWFHQQAVKGVAVVQTESQSRLGLGHYQYPFAYLGCAVGLVFSTRSKRMLCLTMSFRYAATPAERMNINPTKMHSLENCYLPLT